jgi:N-acetylmuramoyl-L-alanine amidase
MSEANGARRRPAAWIAVASSIAIAASLPACAPALRRPGAQPGPPPRVGYERRVDSLESVDAAALRGRRIALDPGHGGFFRGSIGPKGTTEASVNLGVALHLRDLLAARGAQVLLTRESDRDFLAPLDSTLRTDLAERMRIANAFGPELFVSIHHNADAQGAHNVNETQTYWKLGDDGASYELGTDLHRALVRNIGIGANRLLPGNYAVLRSSTAPAVLTETSYITNARVESRLRGDAAQRLEAEALYLGIAAYLARPVPRIAELVAVSTAAGREDSSFVHDVAELRGRVTGTFDALELEVDGARVEPVVTGDRFVFRPPRAWPPGRHAVRGRARLAAAGTSPTVALEFDVRREPGEIRIETFTPPIGRAGGIVALRMTVLDTEEYPVQDSVAIGIRADAGVTPAETTLVARDGVAWAYLRVAPYRRMPPTLRTWIAGIDLAPDRELEGDATTRMIPGEGADPGISASSRLWSLGRHGDPSAAAGWSGFVLATPGDTAVRGAPGTREPTPRLAWLNRDGFAVVVRDSAGTPRLPALPGYRHVHGAAEPPRVAALFGGALHGRRIVIDPAGGGDDAGGSSASGTRGATLNLEVARALAAMLEAAGAEVLLTRTQDLAMSDLERVRRAEAFRPERFVRISHGANPPRIGHYYSSAAGAAWAGRTAAARATLGLPAVPVGEDAQWVIQQTSCPAIAAALGRVDQPADEARLVGPGARRAEAYALLVGLAAEFAPDAAWPADSVLVRDAAGAPVAGAPVTLGGALVIETDARGAARFVRSEPGALEAVVEHARVSARAVLLDSVAEHVLTGPGRP